MERDIDQLLRAKSMPNTPNHGIARNVPTRPQSHVRCLAERRPDWPTWNQHDKVP